MVKFKNKYGIFVIFIFVLLLSLYFPITSKDLIYVNVNNLSNFIKTSEGFLIGDIFSILITKYKIFKIIFYGIITISMFTFIRNITNKKNRTVMYMSIFLFFLIDANILTKSYISTSGFINNFLPILFTLIIFYYIDKDTLYKINSPMLILLGILSTIINPIYGIMIILFTTVKIVSKILSKDKDKKIGFLYIGEIIGLSILCFSSNNLNTILNFSNINDTIFKTIIPIIYSSNFLITLIFITILLIISIKIFTYGNSVKTIISILAITFYAFNHLLISNIYLNYIAYLLFYPASLYILLNFNKSNIYKKRIVSLYTLKAIYSVLLVINSTVNEGNILFLLLIDIIIITSVADYTLPANFIKNVWFTLAVFILAVNTYLYMNANSRIERMHEYIKHNLECDNYNINLPSKYYTELTTSVLPNDKLEREYLLKYYGLEDIKDYNININVK